MKKLTSIILAISFSSFCFGCNNRSNYISARYINTDVYVQVNDGVILDDTRSKITEFLSAFEKEFSVTDENSAIARFNAQPSGSVTLSDDGVNVVEKAMTCYQAFDQKFNPALYPLSMLWKFSPSFPVSNFAPPSQEELDELSLESLNFDNVVLDKAQKTLSKLSPQLKIDLGGIAKGYASQKIGEMLKAKGYRTGYVSIGYSSLFVISAESMGVRHPDDKTKLALNVITDFQISAYQLVVGTNDFTNITAKITGTLWTETRLRPPIRVW